jgi:oxygen-independent coproporphyrinogen-3 oxidase
MARGKSGKKLNLGLYLHIPFCQAICAPEQEIHRSATGEAADTIFFGGGTPSLLDPEDVARLIGACGAAFTLSSAPEITLETNPETATPSHLAALRAAGVNRISFGVQSFDDDELARLGRIHSAARARDAVRDARRAGFTQLSFDLMYWLPGQSADSWRRTVEEAIALEPDHLSLYLLELYPNAPLQEAMAREVAADDGSADWAQAPDDVAADMYLDALGALDAAGFVQYEISNVARPGSASRHNLKYWESGRWIGFGCGAHSTVDGERWKTVAGTTEYVDRIAAGQSVRVGAHHISDDDRVAEALFTGLRLTQGIDVRNFQARFGVEPWSRHGAALQPLVAEGLIWRRDSSFGLTRRGMLVANEILLTFV